MFITTITVCYNVIYFLCSTTVTTTTEYRLSAVYYILYYRIHEWHKMAKPTKKRPCWSLHTSLHCSTYSNALHTHAKGSHDNDTTFPKSDSTKNTADTLHNALRYSMMLIFETSIRYDMDLTGDWLHSMKNSNISRMFHEGLPTAVLPKAPKDRSHAK